MAAHANDAATQRVVIPTKQQMRDLSAIRPGLEAWLRARLGDASLTIQNILLPTGAGVANETLIVEAVRAASGAPRDIGFVVRVGASDHLYLDMDVAVHYRMYEALEREPDIPSPPVIGFEADRTLFGQPFFVMERIAGLVPSDNPNFYERVGSWSFRPMRVGRCGATRLKSWPSSIASIRASSRSSSAPALATTALNRKCATGWVTRNGAAAIAIPSCARPALGSSTICPPILRPAYLGETHARPTLSTKDLPARPCSIGTWCPSPARNVISRGGLIWIKATHADAA
jgi:hypothetical protein